MATKKLPDQAYLRQRLSYNRRTGVLTWKRRLTGCDVKRWNSRYAGTVAGHIMTDRYKHIVVHLDKVPFSAARLIWMWMTGNDPLNEIDHINRNATDNRWSNLRVVTGLQNKWNTSGRRRMHHGLPIGAFRNHGKFYSRINAGGKLLYLGSFNTPQKAHEAYISAKAKLHVFPSEN